MKTNILTNTPVVFLNPEEKNSLLVLYTKFQKLNDKKNIDIVVKMLKENYIILDL